MWLHDMVFNPKDEGSMSLAYNDADSCRGYINLQWKDYMDPWYYNELGPERPCRDVSLWELPPLYSGTCWARRAGEIFLYIICLFSICTVSAKITYNVHDPQVSFVQQMGLAKGINFETFPLKLTFHWHPLNCYFSPMLQTLFQVHLSKICNRIWEEVWND